MKGIMGFQKGELNPMYGKEPWNKGLKGMITWNKMKDEDKIKKNCLECGKEMLVLPCKINTKKYCSRECNIKYRKGKPMENCNPNSFHAYTGKV